MSTEGLARGVVTEEWVEAFERGDLLVTEDSLELMGGLLREAGTPYDLEELAKHLRQHPYSRDAIELQRIADLISPTDRGQAETSVDEDDVEMMSSTQRLVVMSPLLLAVASLYLLARFTTWIISLEKPLEGSAASSLLSFSDHAGTALLAVGAVLAGIAGRRMDSFLTQGTIEFRTDKRTQLLWRCDQRCRAQGHVGFGQRADWRLDDLEATLLPSCRRSAIECTLRLRLLERVALVFSLLAISAFALGVVVSVFTRDSLTDVLLPLLALLAGVVGNAASRAADSAAAGLEAILARAFGVLDTKTPSAARLSRATA